MRLLHTSDWHLGASLYGFSRLEEQSFFLKWLYQTIKDNSVDTLLVSGDVFDSASPSNAAKTLYSNFLASVTDTCCRNIVITGGNHDSPSWLDADAKVFRKLGFYVLGQATDNLDDELIVLNDKSGKACAVICAVPYLRERDLHSFEFGQGIEEHEKQIAEGIRRHYSDIAKRAEMVSKQYSPALPVIAMGHLFVRGSIRDDGESRLIVGTLGEIDSSIFPKNFDYVALGHIHTPQKIGGSEFIRYCGSPLKMSFSEKNNSKQVLLLEIEAKADHNSSNCVVRSIEVPQSRELISIRGIEDELRAEVLRIATEHPGSYLEAVYVGQHMRHDLREILLETLREKYEDSVPVNLVRIRHEPLDLSQHSTAAASSAELKEYSTTDMFSMILEKERDFSSEDKDMLGALYEQILYEMESSSENNDVNKVQGGE